ncbi:MAG: hypothetical protein AB8B74_04020 [Crocinitomicaceae bacterium]
MRTIHNINKWSFGITVVLYAMIITIFFGLIAQALLGGIQIILALVILLQWKQFSQYIQKLISIYWAIVISYAAMGFLITEHINESLGIIYFVIIPMIIAGYFVFVTFKIKNNAPTTLK